jgi:hypothetical protein
VRRYKSDSQANAEALDRRSRTYADEHAASWQVRFNAPTHELSTKALLARLEDALAAETPVKLHEGPDHIDGGGTPAMTNAFLSHLDSRPNSTVGKPDREAILVGTYRRPMAAAIESMLRCNGKVAWWGRIVERVLYGGEPPVVAAIAEGSHQHEAARTANEALSEALRRWTPDKMNLRRERETVDAVA